MGLGIVLLWLAARGVDPAAVSASLARVKVMWAAAAFVSVLVTVAATVVRWRLLFLAVSPPPAWTALFSATVIGQMVNLILPVRLGDVARGFVVHRFTHIPVSQAYTTIAIEKLADVAMIGVAAAGLALFIALPPWLHVAGRALWVSGAVALALCLFLGLWPDVARTGGMRLVAFLPMRLRARVARMVDGAHDGLAALRDWRRGVMFSALTCAVLMLAASTNLLLFYAFDFAIPVAAAVLLLVALQVGSTLVSVPGNLGVFHYVTVLVLSIYSVEASTALAYAIALYVIALAPKIVGGLVLAIWIPGDLGASAIGQEAGA